MDIVDFQVHVFHKMDPDACLFAMDSPGIKGVVIDEIWPGDLGGVMQPAQDLGGGVHRPLTDGARMASMQHPDRFRYLRRINHRDPDLDTIVRQCGEDPHCVALRVEVWPAYAEEMAAGAFERLFRAAAKAELPIFVLTLGQPRLLEPYLTSLPECQFALDHLGLVTSSEDYDYVLGLAKHRNLVLKWCHPHRAFLGGEYPYPPIQQALRRAVDAYGRERVIWASDTTAQVPEVTWAEVLFNVRANELLSPEDREWVLGRAARRLLRWPAA